jgi:murein DD-endopeptidase MepM/ murein hydrolase activator NlpD
MRRSRFGPALSVLLAVAAGPGGADAAETPVVEAAPGTIVRWDASESDACGMDGRRWSPLAGACWFAIDLLREEPSITVSRWTAGAEQRAEIRLVEYPYPVQKITLQDDSRVNLSSENLERVAAERRRIAALWELEGPPRFDLPLASPLRTRGGSGRFGSRRFFNGQPRSPHTGADYAAAAGEPVFAVADGRVALADDLFFSGMSVFIDHGDGLVSMYFHLSELAVEPGAEVESGQRIGGVGQTGRASGPHLHFGIRWKGARVDPELLLGSPASLPTLP